MGDIGTDMQPCGGFGVKSRDAKRARVLASLSPGSFIHSNFTKVDHDTFKPHT